MIPKKKQFGRSRKNRYLSGLCGGLAEYFNFDVNLLRLATLFFIIFTGLIPGLAFYIIAAVVTPQGDE